jgi:hypothetical protein
MGETSIQGFGGGDFRERDNLEDPGVDGRIILNKSSSTMMGAWTGFIWLRIRTACGLL